MQGIGEGRVAQGRDDAARCARCPPRRDDRDGVEQRRAHRSTDLLGQVDRRRRRAGVARLDARRGAGRGGREDEPQPQPRDDEARQHVAEVVRLHRQFGEEHHTHQTQQHPHRHQGAWSHQGQQAGAGQGRRQGQGPHQGQEQDSRLEGRVTQRVLHVEGEEQGEAEYPDRGDEEREERTATGAIGHDAQGQQRMARVSLPYHEHDHQRSASTEAQPGVRVAPPRGDRAAQAEDQGEESGATQHGSHQVQVAGAVPPATGDHHQHADERDAGHDHVHEETPAPGGPLGQGPAQDEADRRARSADRPEDGEGPRSLLGLHESDGERRQGRGGQQGAEDALGRASADQFPEGPRRAAGGRGAREAHETDDQRGPPAPQVAQAPAEEHQGAEGQDVGRDEPLAAGRREVQGALSARQGDVDDRGIQCHHQLDEAQGRQHPPPAVMR